MISEMFRLLQVDNSSMIMTARSEANIQKLVAGGSVAIIQQCDTDSTENEKEKETFLVVFSKYNEG